MAYAIGTAADLNTFLRSEIIQKASYKVLSITRLTFVCRVRMFSGALA